MENNMKQSHELVKDGELYQDQFVAMKSFTDNTVICAGEKPEKVMQEAIERGYPSPVMMFVPKKDTQFFF